MIEPMTLIRVILALTVVACVSEPPRRALMAAGADWTQWGGPTRNFMSDAKGLA